MEIEKDIPPVLWIALVSLGLMILGKIAFSISRPILLVDAALSGAMLYGLYRGYKWAFVLTLTVLAMKVVLSLVKPPEAIIGILVIDALVYVPVIMCRTYFFPDTQASENEEMNNGNSPYN